jgi:predicted dehydrogenase
MFNYAIVGVSSIAPRFAEGLALSDQGRLYAVYSRSLTKAQAFVQKHPADRIYNDYDLLLNDPQVHVVYISTTNSTHYPLALKALQAKKHVIVEKPATLTVADFEHLTTIARENQCFLMEGQKSVFLPTTQKIKQLIASGLIGELRYIYLPTSLDYHWPQDSWMFDLQEGGALRGSACYGLAFSSYISNLPIITSTAILLCDPDKSDYFSSMTFKLGNQCIATTVLGSRLTISHHCEIYGTKGSITLTDFWKAKSIILHTNDTSSKQYDYPYLSEFTYYLNHVNECISNQLIESPVMTWELSLQTIEATANAYANN